MRPPRPTPDFTDEDLMAYADGELAEDRAAALDRALAEDPALAERVGLFVDTRRIAVEALRPMLDTPVPDRLVQRVRALAAGQAAAGNVVAFPPAKPRPIWQLPLAASIALAVGLGAGLMLSGTGGSGPALEIAAVTDSALARALATLPSGEILTLAAGERIEVIATFRAEDEALCREFEYDHVSGTTFASIACHDGQDWQMRLAIAAPAADATGYAPASSLEALDAYLVATNAGAPLPLAEEAAALDALR